MTKAIAKLIGNLLFITGIVFVTLKISGDIDWNWWVVLSPLYVPAVIFFLTLGIVTYIKEKLK